MHALATIALPVLLSMQDPDLIVSAREIWTGDSGQPRATAIAVRDGKIVAVGSIEAIQKLRTANTRLLDFPGDLVTPGLVDAHGHILSLGNSFAEIDVRGAKSPQEVAQRISRWSQEHPGDSWILGRNWDQSLWPGMEFPTAEILDAVVPDRPVWLTRVDGHAAWANSAAMRRAGVTKETQSPSDGQILRDVQGRPTGVFIDGAANLVDNKVPPLTREQITERILAAQEACLKLGLTGVHDAGVGAIEAEVFRALDEQGKLKLRVYGMASPGPHPDVFAGHPPTPAPSDARFQLRAIKLYADGAMGSRGALLFEPYADDPASAGLQLIDEALLRKVTEIALKNGWQICTHAIGDKGNARVLDAYEAALNAVPGAKDARLRIEHAQVVRKSDVARFERLGVIASMQPSHVMTDQRWADIRLGAGSERVAGAYAWRWFLDAGVTLAAGSDFPVEVPNPLRGLFAATTRKATPSAAPWHPGQVMSMDEALRGFTSGAAYASFSESRLGRVKPGMIADLTVINPRGFDPATRQFKETDQGIAATIIGGEVVYQLDR